jgi:hypothetical protein
LTLRSSAVPASTIETPPAEILTELASAAPPMPGGEYLNADVLAVLWDGIWTRQNWPTFSASISAAQTQSPLLNQPPRKGNPRLLVGPSPQTASASGRRVRNRERLDDVAHPRLERDIR